MADEEGRARARMIARRIEVGRAAMGAGDYELAELIFREAARRFESTKLARLADEAHAMAVARQQRDPDAAPPPLPATGSVTRDPVTRDPIVARVEPSAQPVTWTTPASGRVIPGSSSGWPTDTSGEPRTAPSPPAPPPLPPPPPPKPKAASVSKAWLFGSLAVVILLIAIALTGLRGSTTSLPQTVAQNDVNPARGTTPPATSTTTPVPTTTMPALTTTTPPPTTTTPATTSTVPASVQKPPTPPVVMPQPTVPKPPTEVKPPQPAGVKPGVGVKPGTPTVVAPVQPKPPPQTDRGGGVGASGTGSGIASTKGSGPVATGTVERQPPGLTQPPQLPDDSKGKDLPTRGREDQRAAASAEHVAGLMSENAGDFRAALQHYERARQLDPSIADFAQLVARVKMRMKAEATDAITRAKQFDAVDRVNQAIAEYERASRNLLDDDPAKRAVRERLDALRARSR